MNPNTVRCSFPIAARGTATDGPTNPPRSLPPDPCRVARLLSLAYYIEAQIESGELSDYAQAARSLGLTRARLTQVMNLMLLAPEIQEHVAMGELVLTERALRRVVTEPDWAAQPAIVEDIVGRDPTMSHAALAHACRRYAGSKSIPGAGHHRSDFGDTDEARAEPRQTAEQENRR